MKKEELIDEIEESLASRLDFKILSKDRLPERLFENKVYLLFKKVQNFTRKKIIKEFLKRDKEVIVTNDIIKYVKSLKMFPKGEMDFYYFAKYGIFDGYHHLFDISLSIILEHKFGKSKKVLYQIFRDLICEIVSNREDLIFSLGIHKGKYLYLFLSARRYKNGYIISSHNFDKLFLNAKNKTLFLTDRKINIIYDGYVNTKNGMNYIRKNFERIML